MCGKLHLVGFRIVAHSDMVCRIYFRHRINLGRPVPRPRRKSGVCRHGAQPTPRSDPKPQAVEVTNFSAQPVPLLSAYAYWEATSLLRAFNHEYQRRRHKEAEGEDE